MLTALLFIGCMIIPASAAEIDNDSWLNVLDYSTANDTGSNMFVIENGGGERTWNLPKRLDMYMVDVVFTDVMVYGGAVSGVSVHIEGRTYPLTIEWINNKLARAYGAFQGTGGSAIGLQFACSSPQYIEVLQLNVCSAPAEHFATTCYGTVTFNGGSHEFVKDSSVSTPAYTDVYYSGDYEKCQYSVILLLKDWRKYDFIDVQLTAVCWNITSVAANFGGINLDLVTSDIVATNVIANQYLVHMRVDVRGIDRTSTGYVAIQIDGNLLNDGGDNFFMINAASGYVLLQDINPLYYYFEGVKGTLNTGFDRVVEALSPESDVASGYKETAKQQGAQLDDITSAIGSTSKPDAAQLNFDMAGFVSTDAINLASTPIAALFQNEYIFTIFMMAITLAIVGYVLFGKRG